MEIDFHDMILLGSTGLGLLLLLFHVVQYWTVKDANKKYRAKKMIVPALRIAVFSFVFFLIVNSREFSENVRWVAYLGMILTAVWAIIDLIRARKEQRNNNIE